MADVIFNGSTTRKPTALASIELTFDNSDGRIGGLVSVPLRSGDATVGALGIGRDPSDARAFTPAEVELLERLAQLASIALDNPSRSNACASSGGNGARNVNRTLSPRRLVVLVEWHDAQAATEGRALLDAYWRRRGAVAMTRPASHRRPSIRSLT